MSTWPRARRRLAGIAIAAAVLTGAAGAVLGGADWAGRAAAGYVAVAVVALFVPAAITVQVIGGQALAAMLLLDPAGPPPLAVVLVVGGVVATAELLGAVARMHAPLEGGSRDDARATGRAALVGAGAFGAVLLVGAVPGPTGLTAIVLSAAACGGLALLLVRGGFRMGS